MPVPHALLRLLIDGPSHGYHLQRRLAELRPLYPLRNVNVYPVLKDLEEQGLACSRQVLSGARMRKIYEITAEGVAEFERWIDEAPESSLAVETDIAALKLVLAPDRTDAELAWISTAIEELEDEILRRRESREASGPLPRLAKLTSEHKLLLLELRLQYLLEAKRLAAEGDVQPVEPPAYKRILVVDDSPASRALTRHLLTGAGYEVTLADDGGAAWDLLHRADFAALVADVEMPELDGYELLRRVRSSDELAKLPVILNTVRDGVEERASALEAGANDFVCKGFANSGRVLVDSVERLMRDGPAAA